MHSREIITDNRHNRDYCLAEEILKSPSAVWFSPDGRFLAFATFNDTAVREMVYPHYGTPGSFESQYPQQVRIKYPKVRSCFVSLNIDIHENIVNAKKKTDVYRGYRESFQDHPFF